MKKKVYSCKLKISRVHPDTSASSVVNTLPGLRSLGEGGLEGCLRALEDILYPHFSLRSKRGPHRKKLKMGKAKADERKDIN